MRRLQFWTLEILMAFAIILIGTQISFVFEPVIVFFSTIFIPVLISGFLYFLLSPIVNFAEKKKVPRSLGILIIFLLFIGLFVLIGSIAGPRLGRQLTELVNNIPKYVADIELFIDGVSVMPVVDWIVNQTYVDINWQQIGTNLMAYLADLPTTLFSGVSNVLGSVVNVAIVSFTVPVLLFYMLKDGRKFPFAVSRLLPGSFRKEAIGILQETGETLSQYIRGQLIVALVVGTLSYIGYLIIGLPYALVLALCVSVTNIIPYVGPLLGAAPAVIVGLLHSPLMALFVVLVAFIAQQLEGNLISPLVMG